MHPKSCLIAFLSIILCTCNLKAQSIREVYTEFAFAPDSTRTKVWWFHGETETTHEGITADLEAFKAAGVGGIVYYDQVHGKAQGAFPIFSPEWWDALKFSASEAKRLNLTFEINLSNGYVAGGPWISKKMSMKRLCHSQIVVSGGEYYNDTLPRPTTDDFWDVRTIAFPVPKEIEWKKHVLIDRKTTFEKDTILTYDFGRPVTIRALTYSEYSSAKHQTVSMNTPGYPSDKFYGDGFVELPCIGQLEASNDGLHFWTIRNIPPLYNIHYKTKTIAFEPVTARYFRLNLHDWNRTDGQKKRNLEIRSATLSSQAMTDDWESRAGINSDYIGANLTPSYQTTTEVIDSKKIIDLTDHLQSYGRLSWRTPDNEKQWVIMRIAQTSTRGHTKHGRPGQMGLECDKLSKEAAKLQWDNFAKVIIDTLSSYNLKPLGVVMDSHEMGSQNWTFNYDREFKDLQGYDIMTYLPAILGYVVDSKEKSDSVLFHHRQTIAYLVNHRYYAAIDTLAMNEQALLTAQATGNGQSLTSDNISAKGSVRRPQGEFWAKHVHGSYDIKEVSSAAHLYNKPIASAEAYTDAKYEQSLAYLKNLADFAFANQLNEFVVCASAYQPWLNKYPGNTANGREYCLNRNNTLWPLSRGFWDYQSRCAYLLRQGKPVVDICIYLGSEISNKILSYRLPVVPEGYNWDVCTDDALLNVMYANDGRLQTQGGMTYLVLVVERLARLTAQAEAKIESLRKQGVKIYDARTEGDYKLGEFLSAIGLDPDVAFTSANRPDDRLLFAHRTMGNAHIYFVNNHSDQTFSQPLTFRCATAGIVEYWNPDNGARYVITPTRAADNRLTISLTLDAHESGFIILHSDDTMPKPLTARTFGDEEMRTDLSHNWTVDFLLPDTLKTIDMPIVTDWTRLNDTELRYHSGTAIYRRTFTYSPTADTSKRVYLRLRGLEATARVWVNNLDAGHIWCAPWETDITNCLKEGENTLTIEVANQLTNRMIGDLTLPEQQRSTYATTPIVSPNDPLLPAGITAGIDLIVR